MDIAVALARDDVRRRNGARNWANDGFTTSAAANYLDRQVRRYGNSWTQDQAVRIFSRASEIENRELRRNEVRAAFGGGR